MNEQKPSTALAITSLVLGIFSVICFGLLTGLPAIITGHISKNRAAKDPTRFGGAGLALAGLILGYVSILTTVFLVAVLAGMMLPAFAKAKDRAQSIHCINNLKQVALGARLYANDRNGKFPAEFLEMKEHLGSPAVLICPADEKLSSAQDETQFSAERISYTLVTPGIDENQMSPETVFAVCPIHNNIAYADGSVKPGKKKLETGDGR
jgi:hypothetical protein